MEFAFIIWAIGTLPAVASVMCFTLFWFILCPGVAYIIMNIILATDDRLSEKDEKNLKHFIKLCRNVSLISGFFWLLFLITPNKETAYAMAGGYGVQSVVENERVQKIAGQGVDVLEQYLEKTKKELEKEATPQK